MRAVDSMYNHPKATLAYSSGRGKKDSPAWRRRTRGGYMGSKAANCRTGAMAGCCRKGEKVVNCKKVVRAGCCRKDARAEDYKMAATARRLAWTEAEPTLAEAEAQTCYCLPLRIRESTTERKTRAVSCSNASNLSSFTSGQPRQPLGCHAA
jgi:hypothetical protein